MDFPEIVFGSSTSLHSAYSMIRHAMTLDEEVARHIRSMSESLKRTYKILEPYFQRYTEYICRGCKTPCCVNRHGFPDFEDLIVFGALGDFDHEAYACREAETQPCHFLRKDGCCLDRLRRSYRCTWYFCDHVFERFEAVDMDAYLRFDSLMGRLGRQRAEIVRQFERLWRLEAGVTETK